MSRHRFYAGPDAISESTIVLDEDESYHLQRVLRLKEGAVVYVFDGLGAEYECIVLGPREQGAVLSINARMQPPVESPLKVTLAQALAKGEKFDLIIQKAAELGATRFVPLITRYVERSAQRFQARTRLQRWRRISLSAVKQCGRTRLMEIVGPTPYGDFLRDITTSAIICSERGGVSFHQVERMWSPHPPRDLTVLVGPEGGWAEFEIEEAMKAGATAVSLGPRILRTETAGLVIISVLQYLFGDL
jgi:16S rRNA (uracil1498-N3)-methyltransferase